MIFIYIYPILYTDNLLLDELRGCLIQLVNTLLGPSGPMLRERKRAKKADVAA